MKTQEKTMETHKAHMDTVYYDDSPANLSQDCEIRIEENKIIVSYDDYNGVSQYEGQDHGCGHYVLENKRNGGKATLHQIPGSRILEGSWAEEQTQGMWKIRLL